eukprot:m.65894 g.65894  ORF g.65894 m.65894 type:complete len:201 (-) comp12631_c0_seq3:92-694(-)
MSQDERKWRVAIEQLETLAKDIRNFMRAFLYDPRGPAIPWDDFMNKMNAMRAKIALVLRSLGNAHMPSLAARVVVPMQLSTETNEILEVETQRRIHAFTHQIAPDVLRTKLVPEIEAMLEELYSAAAAAYPNPASLEPLVGLHNDVCDKAGRDAEAFLRELKAPTVVPPTPVARPPEAARMLFFAQETGAGLQAAPSVPS